jgi:hypothetical protein
MYPDADAVSSSREVGNHNREGAMKTMRITGVAALTLALAACPGNDGTRDTAVVADDTVGRAAAPGATQRDQMDGMERINLSGIGGAQASGEASLAPDGQSTRVMVTLNNATPGEKQGHIHTGTCDNLGPVVAPLEPVNVQAGGTGTSTSTVDLPAQQIMEGDHVIAYHEAGGQPGRPVVCGEVGRAGRLGL